MDKSLNIGSVFGWLFGLLVVAIGILNLILVHPVPGIAYLLLSGVFLPPINTLLKNSIGISIPLLVKVFLGIVLILFTFGVSDLGDMIDKL